MCCLEGEDFASGSSSRSTKLLWAGSRYLVQALVKLFTPSNWWARGLIQKNNSIFLCWGIFFREGYRSSPAKTRGWSRLRVGGAR